MEGCNKSSLAVSENQSAYFCLVLLILRRYAVVIFIIIVTDAPPTPISPFKPHTACFPTVNQNFSVALKNGFVVLNFSEDEVDEQVSCIFS